MDSPSEPYNLASALQKDAKSHAEKDLPKIDWSNLKYAEIESLLNNAPISDLLDYCSQNPRRCEETLRKRRLREFGDDSVEEAYLNPIHNYWAAQVRYLLRKDQKKKAEAISRKLLEYLKGTNAQPKTIQVYSANLGFNWFPRGTQLKNFKISPAQEHELREKLVTLGLNVDDWAEIFDFEGGRAFYFMSEFELNNFLPHRGQPPTFKYFLDKLGLTEETYKIWQ